MFRGGYGSTMWDGFNTILDAEVVATLLHY